MSLPILLIEHTTMIYAEEIESDGAATSIQSAYSEFYVRPRGHWHAQIVPFY